MESNSLPEGINANLYTLIGSNIQTIHELPHGANSRIFKLITVQGKTYCLKQYVRRSGDRRDRLGTEFNAFTFLRQHGVRDVPEPVAYDKKNTIGIYSFVFGNTLRSHKVSDSMLFQAVGLLQRIHALRKKATPDQFGLASEACVSMNDLIHTIQEREARLQKISYNRPALRKFFTAEWDVAWKKALTRIHTSISDQRVLSQRLIENHQTLSPSDFGFHNAICDSHGKLVFIDFEYFGWDDPAKLICDFLLHPGMNLTKAQKQWFIKRTISIYRNEPTLAKRLPMIYVLLGFKWSLIMLNCFLHTIDSPLTEAIAKRQLVKARRNLRQIFTMVHQASLTAISL